MTPTIGLARAFGVACALALVLAACASTVLSPTPGTTREEVERRWGEPRASYALPTGQRLFFRVKPGELQRLDFDTSGRLVVAEQVFTAENFRALSEGRWDAAAVQRQFGPPTRSTSAGDSKDGGRDEGKGARIWVYSWLDFGTWRLAQITLDSKGIVQGIELAQDPSADDRYR